MAILGVQAAQWTVLHLISIQLSWQDSTDHVGCNNSCSPTFQNLMAEPAVSCEWMLNSDCFISDRQLWTLGCSSRSGKIRAKMRRLWNWFEGLVYIRLIFNRMQIKDLSFFDKFLIDCKWPLHYQLLDKRVLKTSIFSEGRLYQCISDGLSCCTSHFRSTALIVWNVPQEVVKYERQCADFEMDLKDLYYSSWPSIGFKLKAFYFLINALLIASVLLIASYNINKFQKHHYLARGGCISLQQAACSKQCAFSNVQSR